MLSGGQEDGALATLVAASFLAPDGDTRAARAFKALAGEPDGPPGGRSTSLMRLARVLGGTAPDRVGAAHDRARQALARAGAAGIGVCPVGAEAYPRRLWEIADPPLVLWLRGRDALLSEPAVAVVGSRRATPSSLSVAFELGRELAANGLVVVSGMARGVDGAAHRGALEAGGRTVAVLGSGVDVVYPRQHGELAVRIARAGALLSEYPPGTPPGAHRFPLRNRVISGLSLAVVVIEAHERSGSLITARAALDQGRDVLAVPGTVASGRHRGSHALIKDGARLVETVDDVLDEIGWIAPGGRSAPRPSKYLRPSRLGEAMASGEAYSVDDLAGLTGWSAADVLAELSALELDGRVVRSGGEHFTKIDGPA